MILKAGNNHSGHGKDMPKKLKNINCIKNLKKVVNGFGQKYNNP